MYAFIDCDVSPRMLFVTQSTGHNPNFIQWICEGWVKYSDGSSLIVVLTSKFDSRHQNLVSRLKGLDPERLQIRVLTQSERSATLFSSTRLGRIAHSVPPIYSRTELRYQRRKEWYLSQNIAEETASTGLCFPNFDFYQMNASLDKDCRPFIGIYHNLYFHYQRLFGNSLTLKERIRALFQQRQLERVLKNGSCRSLLLLDPVLVDHLKTKDKQNRIHFLPTPAASHNVEVDETHRLIDQLGIDKGRTIFLLQGAIGARRGIFEVVGGLLQLPAEQANRTCLLLVGEHSDNVHQRLAKLRECSKVQVISVDEFVPEEILGHYYAVSDIVLAVHPRHFGTSVSLAYAANSGKPVLASDFGLLGAQVKRNKLGLAIDATRPESIADGILASVDGSIYRHFDSNTCRHFAKINSVEAFQQVVTEHLMACTV